MQISSNSRRRGDKARGEPSLYVIFVNFSCAMPCHSPRALSHPGFLDPNTVLIVSRAVCSSERSHVESNSEQFQTLNRKKSEGSNICRAKRILLFYPDMRTFLRSVLRDARGDMSLTCGISLDFVARVVLLFKLIL